MGQRVLALVEQATGLKAIAHKRILGNDAFQVMIAPPLHIRSTVGGMCEGNDCCEMTNPWKLGAADKRRIASIQFLEVGCSRPRRGKLVRNRCDDG